MTGKNANSAEFVFNRLKLSFQPWLSAHYARISLDEVAIVVEIKPLFVGEPPYTARISRSSDCAGWLVETTQRSVRVARNDVASIEEIITSDIMDI